MSKILIASNHSINFQNIQLFDFCSGLQMLPSVITMYFFNYKMSYKSNFLDKPMRYVIWTVFYLMEEKGRRRWLQLPLKHLSVVWMMAVPGFNVLWRHGWSEEITAGSSNWSPAVNKRHKRPLSSPSHPLSLFPLSHPQSIILPGIQFLWQSRCLLAPENGPLGPDVPLECSIGNF